MNDIEHDKAQGWCNRLHKLMKEKNYTQKSFLKEYKEKYGGGTQANISRWLRVGSKIENGKTIGFPSYETMSNLADFFGVSVGYLIGETDYESFEMEKVLNQMPEGQEVKAGRILEINPNHDIFNAMKKVYENNPDKVKDYASILYDQALLIEGFSIDNPVDFSNKICDLMIELNK